MPYVSEVSLHETRDMATPTRPTTIAAARRMRPICQAGSRSSFTFSGVTVGLDVGVGVATKALTSLTVTASVVPAAVAAGCAQRSWNISKPLR